MSVVHFPEQKDFFETLLSGEGDFAMLARWTVHRFIQDDVVSTWNHLAQHPELYEDRFRVE